MTTHAEHLVLVTDRAAGEQVLAAWYRALPEDDLVLITVRQGNWKSDIVYICTARSDYLQVLIEIVDETVPRPACEVSYRFLAAPTHQQNFERPNRNRLGFLIP